jgi:uncharacterized protein
VTSVTSPLIGHLLRFGGVLRRLGLVVHTGRLLDVVDALAHIDLANREDVYHTCRTLLVHSQEEMAIFDRAFAAFWRHVAGQPEHSSTQPPHAGRERQRGAERPRPADSSATGAHDVPEIHDRQSEQSIRTWSSDAAIADKDFAAFTDEEQAMARAALERLNWNPGERRTRRWIAGRGPRLDIRLALSRSVRTAGDLVLLPRRRRRSRPRPLVLICDVSGSMERYSRMLIHFAHAIGRRHERLEAFLFSTRLTRITTEIRTKGLSRAVAAVSRSVPDWSGGTRTGDALRELNQRWSRRVLHRGPVVLLISDGWDRGDPMALREQIARLQRSCHRLIWLNPLIGTAGYEPLTRGLQAALPFVDDFLPARTLNNLADLAEHLSQIE